MNDELPDDIRALLADERAVEPPPAAARARVLERLSASVSVASASALPVGKVVLALGVITIAAATYFALRPPAQVDLDAPEAAAPLLAPRPTAPIVREIGREIAREPTPAPPRRVHNEATIDNPPKPMVASPSVAPEPPKPKTLLGAERALLDSARSALGHGDTIGARVALRKHEREFGGGQLEEEREALWVIVLEADEEPAQALARAKVFRERWPTSIFLHSVNEAEKRAGGQLR